MFLFVQNNKKSKSWCICVANEIKTREEKNLKENGFEKKINKELNITWSIEIFDLLDRYEHLKNLKFNPDGTGLKLASGARTQKERSLEKKLIIKSQKKNILKSLED